MEMIFECPQCGRDLPLLGHLPGIKVKCVCGAQPVMPDVFILIKSLADKVVQSF